MKNSFKQKNKRLSVLAVAKTLGALSQRWLNTKDAHRLRAVKALVQRGGYSPRMGHAALDATFSELTEKKMLQFLQAELGDPLYLDGFQRDARSGHFYHALPPKMVLHVFASTSPNPAIWSLVMGLLLQSNNIIKPSHQDPGLLDIYLESLKKASPALFAHVLRLSSGHAAIKPYLKRADVIVCYGDDETIRALRSQAGPQAHFMGYGHRVSLAIFLKEALTKQKCGALAAKAAHDAWMVDGRGCLSPVVVYVQAGGEVSVDTFEAQFRAALLRLHSDGMADFGARSQALMSSLKVPVASFQTSEALLRSLKPKAALLQAVALEGGPTQRKTWAKHLSAIGVNRVCRAGAMQNPPLTWHHDGKPNIASWLTWTDLE